MIGFQYIDALVKLGEEIKGGSSIIDQAVIKAKRVNPWFTEDDIHYSLQNIAHEFLNRTNLENWLSSYSFDKKSEKYKIGLILAGNIPMVGFHDILCVLLSGNLALVKLSEKDNVLIPVLIDQLAQYNSDIKNNIHFVNKLKDYDAIIATGSDTTAKHFEKYFSHVPRIIRKTRPWRGYNRKKHVQGFTQCLE